MAYPPILVDQDGNPIPQRWNEAQSKWEPYEGIILGPDGQPISSSNPLHVRVWGRRMGVSRGVYDQQINAAPSARVIIPLTPPPDELWRIRQLRIQLPAPIGATSGEHAIYLMVGSDDSTRDTVFWARFAHNVAVIIAENQSRDELLSSPRTDVAQITAIQNIVATASSPLTINYANDTDAAQTGMMRLVVTREVEYLA